MSSEENILPDTGTLEWSVLLSLASLAVSLGGKDDIFGEDIKENNSMQGQSMYCVRALSYCDINKIDLSDLREILRTYPEFADSFLPKFQVTFNLRKGTLLQLRAKMKMDDETLRFIRQRRPRLQCKRRTFDSESSRTSAMRRRVGSVQGSVETRRPSRDALDLLSGNEDESRVGIVELSVERTLDEDSLLKTTDKDGKGKPSIMKDPTGTSSSDQNSFQPTSAASYGNKFTGAAAAAAAGGSQSWKQRSMMGAQMVDLPPLSSPRGSSSMQSFHDIDNRLVTLHERMQNFESELCTTVDAILNLLGHKPRMTKDALDQIAPVSPVRKSQRPFRSRSTKFKPSSEL
ncbi:Potassium voltage-gated channel sub H member 2 [Bulinus truncatus]|nr:Potassium voltage-gated channel sub H member 2 [Bulinus truncatus]